MCCSCLSFQLISISKSHVSVWSDPSEIPVWNSFQISHLTLSSIKRQKVLLLEGSSFSPGVYMSVVIAFPPTPLSLHHISYNALRGLKCFPLWHILGGKKCYKSLFMNNEIMRTRGTFIWKCQRRSTRSGGADFGTFFCLFCTKLKITEKNWHKLWGHSVTHQLVVEKLLAPSGKDLMYVNQVKSTDSLIKACVAHSFHWVFMAELTSQFRSEKGWKTVNIYPHRLFLKDIMSASQSSIASLWKNYC